MEPFTRAFIRASLAYLALGASLGVVMLAFPGLYFLRFAHMHINLLGWVSMMIYGVAYHVLPRFTGNPLYSRGLAWTHFGFVNVGLTGMVLFGGLGGGPYHPVWGPPLLAAGAVEALGIGLFVFNLWMSIREHPATTPFPVRPGVGAGA